MVRFKSRYVLLEILSNEFYELTVGRILNVIKENVEKLNGTVGLCRLGNYLSIKYFNSNTGLTMIRVPRSCIKEMLDVLMSIKFTNQSSERSFSCKIIHISGTIKSSRKRAIKYLAQTLRDHELEFCKNDINSVPA